CRRPDVSCGGVAGDACGPSALQRVLMFTFIGRWFDSWLAEVATLTWLALALIGAIVEVSIPHFGFAFVSAGAIAAGAAAYFGFDIVAQIFVFVVVLTVSILALRSRLVGYIAGGK